MILPVAVFAEWGIGGAALYLFPALFGQPIDITNLNVNSLIIFLDAGLALDRAIFRLPPGAGPIFTNNFGQSNAAQAGLNARIGADVRILFW